MNDNNGKAILWMTLSALGFALMGAAVHDLGNIPLIVTVFSRNLIILALTGVIVFRRRENPISIAIKYPSLVLRSISGLFGVFLFFYALQNLPLAEASLLNKLSPFVVVLLARIFLGEPTTKKSIVAMVIAFIGTIFVINPGSGYSLWPSLAGIGSAFFAGSAYTIIRSLKGKIKPHLIVFFFSLFSTVIILPFVIFKGAIPDSHQLLLLTATGVFAGLGQYALTKAFHYSPAGKVSVLSYLSVIFALIVGIILWDEFPGTVQIIGGSLILIGATVNSWD
ncbi:DMT family transporter [bacterium]|nr:DMT family transporter [bacterium]